MALCREEAIDLELLANSILDYWGNENKFKNGDITSNYIY